MTVNLSGSVRGEVLWIKARERVLCVGLNELKPARLPFMAWPQPFRCISFRRQKMLSVAYLSEYVAVSDMKSQNPPRSHTNNDWCRGGTVTPTPAGSKLQAYRYHGILALHNGERSHILERIRFVVTRIQSEQPSHARMSDNSAKNLNIWSQHD